MTSPVLRVTPVSLRELAQGGRIKASSGKLTTAAQKHESMDNNGAAALAAVRQGAAGITPLVPGGPGAGGLGTGR